MAWNPLVEERIEGKFCYARRIGKKTWVLRRKRDNSIAEIIGHGRGYTRYAVAELDAVRALVEG